MAEAVKCWVTWDELEGHTCDLLQDHAGGHVCSCGATQPNNPACDDAMRLLEAIATIIDGPIADTRLHDWSGLPERTRLALDGLQRVRQWAQPDPQNGLMATAEATKHVVHDLLATTDAASPTSIEQLVIWLQGEKAAASRVINSGGPEQAVMAAVGLHAAYRAILAKIAGYSLPARPAPEETR